MTAAYGFKGGARASQAPPILRPCARHEALISSVPHLDRGASQEPAIVTKLLEQAAT
jgi:hypothetical protein